MTEFAKISRNSRTLTAARLREVLSYDDRFGEFVWLVDRPNAPAGSAAGAINNAGYVIISVDGTRYLRSRLVWLYVTGEWPWYQLAHRDENQLNDRFPNLVETIPRPAAVGLARKPGWKRQRASV